MIHRFWHNYTYICNDCKKHYKISEIKDFCILCFSKNIKIFQDDPAISKYILPSTYEYAPYLVISKHINSPSFFIDFWTCYFMKKDFTTILGIFSKKEDCISFALNEGFDGKKKTITEIVLDYSSENKNKIVKKGVFPNIDDLFKEIS